ncbi:hypothetical protein [cf. Phormidesmis sp. LEGE 11477]|uniref:hypothetical protein n=1 Tax=cf. Phormidesmis sp. LEGE 11477 TaxID=1828680 RepID=UPI0018820C0E|nr:hypothetical protein [cf. Phormidesmis sp. LEGE 11477]MBE9060954.1 hypothetical protein [cf. Phormidesmis sp. LEGE 11477]
MPTSAAASSDLYQQQVKEHSYPVKDYQESTERPSSYTSSSKFDTSPSELTQPAPTQEVLVKQDAAPQSSRLVPLVPTTIFHHTDPYRLIAAKRRHSRLSSYGVSGEPRASSIAAQLPEQISQFNTRFSSNIKQQPERFRTAVVNKKAKLQQLSAQQIRQSRRDLETFFEDVVKTPLRRLFKRIESLSHDAIIRLN